MKTIKTKLNLIMVSLALLLAAPMANAFYMAEAGRWINRDPISDFGSPINHGMDALSVSVDLNLFQFVRNEPTTLIDLWGLIWMSGGQDKTPDASTIVCDGQDGIRVKLAPCHQNMECGLTDCVMAHENSHIDDVLGERPNICKGKKDNTSIFQTYNPTIWKSEIKAANAGIDCAKGLRFNATADCLKAIDDFIKEEEAYRKQFQDKLDGWRRSQ